jgi:hypothetical protein
MLSARFTESATGIYSEVDSDDHTGGKSNALAWTVNPAATLSFTSLNPSSFTTTTAPYTAVTTGTGSNFTNLAKIVFVWTGSTSGTATWNKGDSNWTTKLAINSDTSLTMSPTVVAAGDPAGTTNWTVTLTDSSAATASQTFTVTYTPAPATDAKSAPTVPNIVPSVRLDALGSQMVRGLGTRMVASEYESIQTALNC